jgi:transcriptional regulator with XRE-family HTH domain
VFFAPRVLHTRSVSSLHKRFGLRLRQLRLEKGLSQAELAEKLGCSLNHVNFIERGLRGVSFRTLEKLEKIFDVQTPELFRYEPPENIGNIPVQKRHPARR